MAMIFSPKKADVKSVESSNRALEALNGVFKQAESKLSDAQVTRLIEDGQKLVSCGNSIKTVPEATAKREMEEIVAKQAKSPKGPARTA